jgi:hypothetical protein
MVGVDMGWICKYQSDAACLQITEEECKSHADMEWTACDFRSKLSKL